MQHALLIINPHSRNGQAEALAEAMRLLGASGIEVVVCESESEAHLVSLIEDYEREDGIVILAGGDGTISSALEAIYTCQRTLAILPMGTANDLARSIGVPEDLLAAAQVIVDDRRERISLGKVNKQFFVNAIKVSANLIAFAVCGERINQAAIRIYCADSNSSTSIIKFSMFLGIVSCGRPFTSDLNSCTNSPLFTSTTRSMI